MTTPTPLGMPGSSGPPPAVRSCAECMSYLTREEAAFTFKKDTGAPMCARFGIILGRPGQASEMHEKLLQSKAKNCAGYGEPRPRMPLAFQTNVTRPSPHSLMDPIPDDHEKRQVSSCLGCKHFVNEETVVQEFGWVGGLCGYTGRLLLGNRLTLEARACPVRRPGSGMTTEAMLLIPEYELGSKLMHMKAGQALDNYEPQVNDTDPREYESDKDVSESEKASGIRAWRKVTDPMGTDNFVFLPIYSDDHFDDSDRALIPRTGDDEHPELYQDHGGLVYKTAVCWVGLDETPALWGESGTGKTELFRHMAWLMNVPFRRISITATSEVDDLIGKTQYSKDAGTYFVYGRLVHGWQSPGVLCLDEPNVGPPEVWQAIRPLTDNSKQLVVDQNKGERVPRHVDCYLGMAMNPAWDVRNVGAQQLADADGSRLMHVYVTLPPKQIEKHILKQRCSVDGFEPTDKQLDLVLAIAEDIRAMSEEQTLPLSWGVRNNIKAARALQYFDLVTAYKMAVADSLEPETRDRVLDIVKAYRV